MLSGIRDSGMGVGGLRSVGLSKRIPNPDSRSPTCVSRPSPSTARLERARNGRARDRRRRWGTATSTAGRCTAPSGGRPSGTAFRSTTKPRSKRWPNASRIVVTDSRIAIDETRRDARDPHAGRLTAPRPRWRDCRGCAAVLVAATARVRRRRRHCDGRPRYRHRCVSRRRREDLSWTPSPETSAPAAAPAIRRHAGAARQLSQTSRRLLTERDRSRLDAHRRRRSTRRPMPSCVDTTGKAVSKTLWRRCWRWCGAKSSLKSEVRQSRWVL